MIESTREGLAQAAVEHVVAVLEREHKPGHQLVVIPVEAKIVQQILAMQLCDTIQDKVKVHSDAPKPPDTRRAHAGTVGASPRPGHSHSPHRSFGEGFLARLSFGPGLGKSMKSSSLTSVNLGAHVKKVREKAKAGSILLEGSHDDPKRVYTCSFCISVRRFPCHFPNSWEEKVNGEARERVTDPGIWAHIAQGLLKGRRDVHPRGRLHPSISEIGDDISASWSLKPGDALLALERDLRTHLKHLFARNAPALWRGLLSELLLLNDLAQVVKIELAPLQKQSLQLRTMSLLRAPLP